MLFAVIILYCRGTGYDREGDALVQLLNPNLTGCNVTGLPWTNVTPLVANRIPFRVLLNYIYVVMAIQLLTALRQSKAKLHQPEAKSCTFIVALRCHNNLNTKTLS